MSSVTPSPQAPKSRAFSVAARAWRTIVPEDAQFTVVPDWVCEILSPRTAATDRSLKMPYYARCGVAHAWLVDPAAQTLEVYRRHELGWLLVATFEGDVVVRAEPFDATGLDLATLWRW